MNVYGSEWRSMEGSGKMGGEGQVNGRSMEGGRKKEGGRKVKGRGQRNSGWEGEGVPLRARRERRARRAAVATYVDPMSTT